MNTVNLSGPKKHLVTLSIGGLLLILLRMWALSGAFWTNVGMVEINQHPLWQSILAEMKVTEDAGLRQAIERNPHDDALWQAQGMVHFAQGEEEKALVTWRGNGLDPAAVAIQQGRYAREEGRQDIALAWYEYAVQLDSQRDGAWHEIGIINQELGRRQAAKLAFEQAHALGNAESADFLAKLWRDEGNHEAAVEVWRSALEKFPVHLERLRWWHGLVNSLRAMESWDRSLLATQSALEEFPDEARLYVERSYAVYYANQDAEEALALLRHAITLDPEMALPYAAIGDILVQEDRYAEAVGWYTQAIDRESGNRSWEISRAIAARASGNVDLSLQLFEEVIDRHPEWDLAHYQIALAYHQNGRTREAVDAIERALTLADSRNPLYLARAGIIYEAQGEIAQAESYFEEALLLDPNNEVALQGLERIDNE